MDSPQNAHLRLCDTSEYDNPSPVPRPFTSLYDNRMAAQFRDEDSLMTAALHGLESRAGVGPKHPDVAEMCLELGRIHLEDDMVKKAVYCFERAWRVLSEVHGRSAPDTLLAQEELAMALHRAGEHMRADAMMTATMEAMERVAARHNHSVFAEEKSKREQKRLKEMMEKQGVSLSPVTGEGGGGGAPRNLWQRAVGNMKGSKRPTGGGDAGGDRGAQVAEGNRNLWQRAVGKAKVVNAWGPPPAKQVGRAGRAVGGTGVGGGEAAPKRNLWKKAASKAKVISAWGPPPAKKTPPNKPRPSSAAAAANSTGPQGEKGRPSSAITTGDRSGDTGNGLLARLRKAGMTGGGTPSSTPEPPSGGERAGGGLLARLQEAGAMGGSGVSAVPEGAAEVDLSGGGGGVGGGLFTRLKQRGMNDGGGGAAQGAETHTPSRLGSSSSSSPAAKARLPSNTTRITDVTDAARLATAAALSPGDAPGSPQRTSTAVGSPLMSLAGAARAASAVRKAKDAFRNLGQTKAERKWREEEAARYKAASAEAAHKTRAFAEAVENAGNSEDNYHIVHKVDRLPSKKDIAAKGISRIDTGLRRR